MDIAYEEATRMKDEYISTEHILLAIASERNTPSANILREAGISKERIAEAITQVRNGHASPSRRRRTSTACWKSTAAT